MNRVWALVPLKDFAGAKSRLTAALDADERRALALAMARDVAAALARSRTVARVLMVSDVPALDRLIGVDGVEHFDTRQARGLNEDLAEAAGWAGAQGATHVLVAHADLPRLTPRAVDRFVRGAGPVPGVRAAACKEGRGTNLLLAPVPLPLPLVFGRDSLARFRLAAAAAGVAIDVVRDAALAADIDEPGDLAALFAACARGEPAGRATAGLLRALMPPTGGRPPRKNAETGAAAIA